MVTRKSFFTGLVALTFVFSLLTPTQAHAIEIGSDIQTDVDSLKTTTEIRVEAETLGEGSSLPTGGIYKLLYEPTNRTLALTCGFQNFEVTCLIATSALLNFLNPISNWSSGETLDLYLVASESGVETHYWPKSFLKTDSFVPKTLQYSDSTNGSYLINSDPEIVTVSARILNRTNLGLEGVVSLEINGEPVASEQTSGEEITISYSNELLEEGQNSLRLLATTEYGTLERLFVIEKYLPQITDVVIQAPTTFYPVRDGYQDTLQFDIDISTPNGREIPGSGYITIKTYSKTTLGTWRFTTSGLKTIVYSGLYKSKPVSGSLYVTVKYSVSGGNSITKTLKITASKKKLTNVSKSVSFPAWSLLVSCGPFDYSCNHYSGTSDRSGIELYNESFDRTHQSIFRLPVPTSAYKWKVSLNSFVSGSRSASYSLHSVDESFSGESSVYLGKTTTRTKWKGTVTSAYSTQISETGSYLRLTSPSWGSVYFKSMTVTYVTSVLK
jgi:hypothetical protein